MRIGLISDTHDRLTSMRNALARFRQLGIDTLIHPGDVVAPFAAKLLAEYEGRVYATYGNNDGERRGLKSALPQIQDGPLFVEIGGQQVLVHHFVDWCDAADIARADVIVTGHTHEASVDTRDGKLFINPGECCGWLTGRCTAAVWDVESNQVEKIEVSP